MKKIIFTCITAILISVVLYGCAGGGSKKSGDTESTGKGTSSATDNSKKDGKVSVSTTDSSVKVKDDKGNMVQSGGDISWPSDIPSDIPKWEGKLNGIYHSAGIGSSIQFSTDLKQLKAYVEKIKAAGYAVEQEADTDAGYSVAMKKSGWYVCVTFVGSDSSDQYGQLIYYKDTSDSSSQ